jgi:hypothetical protein
MRYGKAIWRGVSVSAILALFALLPSPLRAQLPMSNLCQTAFGICPVGYAPVNSPCRCARDPGRIVMPPPNWGNACGTAFGVCRVNFAPIGSRCSCGRDPGQIIGR